MPTPFRSNAVRLAVAVAASLAFVACGSDDEKTTSATTDVGGATATKAPAPSDAVEATDVADTTGTSGKTDAADTTTAAESTPSTSVDGEAYTSAQGDYTVVFPGQPTEQTQSQPLPDGSKIDLVLVGYEFDDGFMASARGQYPDGYVLDPAVALQGAQDQALANVGGTLISSADITLQGRPGKEFSATVTSGGQTGTVLQRVYLDDLVIYQQVFTGPGKATFTDPDLATFFDSFAFTTG